MSPKWMSFKFISLITHRIDSFFGFGFITIIDKIDVRVRKIFSKLQTFMYTRSVREQKLLHSSTSSVHFWPIVAYIYHDARVTEISHLPFNRIVNKRFKLLGHHDRYRQKKVDYQSKVIEQMSDLDQFFRLIFLWTCYMSDHFELSERYFQ